MIDDFYSEDFTLLIGGEGLDGIAVDVYLPDESQAIETEIVFVDVTESGLPLRRERIEGDEFPLGTYNFDVHIDDETYHFAWLRSDNAYNTVSLVCVDRQTVSDDGEHGIETGTAMSEAPILDDGVEVTALLPTDARYSIDEKDCSVLVNDRIVGDFNLSITGHRQDKMSVDVYLPGEAEPMKMDHVHNYTVDVGGLTPVRTEWAVGESFPMGWYTFDVHIEDATYRFQWLRQDDAYNTFGLTCLFAPENEDGEYVYHLADGSSLELANSACSVFSITWESEFRIIAGGARHADIQIDVYFPGEESPAAFDSSEVNALESGTPFRLDTIVGEAFPLGLYKLVVTIGEQTYQIAWDRQDPVYNTVGASCIVNG